jgi:hypothetical protein
MKTKVRRVGYFYFDVEDAAGACARLLGRLAEANVNLLSFVAFPTGADRAQITVVPRDADTFAAAAQDAGLTPSPRKECFLVQGEDRVGAAHEILKRLADARISFTAGSACSAGGRSYAMTLFVKPSDLAEASRALGA